MSTNPFEDENGTFHVLVNDEGQRSLWPTFAPLPAGWRTVLADADRSSCLEHVLAHWCDLRPARLSARLTGQVPAREITRGGVEAGASR
ncbi:MbtH family protein [Frankia sp. AgKG'84/4]|uniref:MbtH family protein n=1 Tax=Frankia sp. AgKG'84/4 TaxID=573490 RepID=UPI0020102C40|nr:MbtH family protein [Frankia sp. AgKG'84/4]MCL9798162.1 MbtH family protein [Frankia sp. AgKG'84/4]